MAGNYQILDSIQWLVIWLLNHVMVESHPLTVRESQAIKPGCLLYRT